ncbi:hypothetical protein CQZ93_15420 [Ochrobactrum vermis]|nr:hypothetical protein CQZ93_15420 [Ochrobactrum vermis]
MNKAVQAHSQDLGRELISAVVAWMSERQSVDHFVYPVAEQNTASRWLAEFYGGCLENQNDRCRDTSKYRALIYKIPPSR